MEASQQRDHDKELAFTMDAMAESMLEMSDAEIEAEIREEGLDPDAAAARTRAVMRTAAARAISGRDERLYRLVLRYGIHKAITAKNDDMCYICERKEGSPIHLREEKSA